MLVNLILAVFFGFVLCLFVISLCVKINKVGGGRKSSIVREHHMAIRNADKIKKK
ncbi:hypothetical protein [Raoultella terrigena]|uniref:hypothetical protein n=1 Tax=Raoultella terrigena TaxID=577 RepID=UPI0013E3A4DA|nr:hypothetical protein [Raoultella terrigena]